MSPELFAEMVAQARANGEALVFWMYIFLIALAAMVPLFLFGAMFASSQRGSNFGVATMGCSAVVAFIALIGAGICGFNGFPMKNQPIMSVIGSKAFQDSIIQPVVVQKTQEVLRDLYKGLSPQSDK